MSRLEDAGTGSVNIFVCIKQVLDPDALNAYALWGRLELDETRRAFRSDITTIMNAYDEQAIEAALRLRDAGLDCAIVALAVGADDTTPLLRHALAMGCDDAVQILEPAPGVDGLRIGQLLAAVIHARGGADLVLCGRQGSDYDQGVVPGVLAELLGTAYVAMAAGITMDGERLRVRRVTPLGEQVVLASLPVTVSVSNELGTPRYPTAQGRMRARRQAPALLHGPDLVPLAPPGVALLELAIPEIQGQCEVIDGETPEAQAAALLARLQEAGALRG